MRSVFPLKDSVGLLDSHESRSLCMGSGLRSIQAMDQLRRRGWVLASYCCMCKNAEESRDCLVHCGEVRGL